ncbi:hypothetical protein [Actinomycetospora soli]|uniref:hypothetical protein n=1 Tax=Actinomycetospora soli TaxID=2893887 RepID=UPI001E4CB650|nr:hypothetical protein [Actinomycetospora soli]MCD2188465.1 hypothetical protein [Actinomycetospora soli]
MTSVTPRSAGTLVVPAPRRVPDLEQVPGPPGRSSWWASPGGSAVLGLLAATALTAVAVRGLGDDSYISLDYARTLVEHRQWGLVPGRGANTATSPLNVWLLALGLGATGTVTGAVWGVLAAAFAVVGAGMSRIGRAIGASPLLPVVSLALLATSPLLASTVGLETYLGVAVVVAVAVAALEDRPVLVGVGCGLAVLVRPDYLVPVAVVVLLLLRARGPLAWLRRTATVAIVAGTVALPWHLWAWFELGGFVPDTFSFKTNPAGGHVPSLIAMFDSLYWSRTPVAVVVVGVLVLAGWTVALGSVAVGLRRAPRAVLGAPSSPAAVIVAFAASGTAHIVALMVINAYPQAWYYGPLVAGCTLATAVALGMRSHRAVLTGVAVYCVIAGLVAGQGGVPWRAADMNSNFTDAATYLAIGRDVSAVVGSAPVASPGEIGALAWGCRCDIVDQFSARGNARPLLDHRYDLGGPLSRAVLRLNARHRPDVPAPVPAYKLRYVRGDDPMPSEVVRTWWAISPQTGLPFRIVLVAAS